MASVQTKEDFHVLIVGAGPSGLLLALLLARKGIKVTVLEKSRELDRQPRASYYGTPSLHEFARAGVLEDVEKEAFHAMGMSWRHADGSLICQIIDDDMPKEYRRLSLPLDSLLPLLQKHLDRHENARTLFGYEVIGLGQDEGRAWVDVKTDEGETRMYADYAVGCDGGNSTVRRKLFGPGKFPGKTWDVQIVATNTYYPGLFKHGWHDTNFLVSPEHFPMIAQIANDGLLRITYGEEGNLTREQMLERQPEKFKQFVPGAPEPSEYKIVNFSPYKIHQRCAETFRSGRFLLAADAAHLCNPFGGMGLTGGFADVGGLFDCLYGIYSGQANDSILDKYDEIRREKYWKVIDPVSSGNLQRLWHPAKEDIEKDEFFQTIKKAETDREFARKMAEGMNAVMHDFTQYYS
ncbi:hypothetical protein Q7P37_007339 [Cladosporium fusiforme]